MKNLKKLLCLVLALAMIFALAACGSSADTEEEETTSEAETETEAAETEDAAEAEEEEEAEAVVYKVGICNYVDDASLNQIVENIQTQLETLGEEYGVTFEISYDNCNADATVLEQIIANFIADEVDLMVGVATPVAMAMQAATEDNQIPVVFAAVSDPVSAGVVDSLEEPGSNITGTSDYLDTAAIMNLIFAANPDADKIGLLYDVGQDSSTTAIAEAKAYLDELGIEYVERTGTTVDEVMLAAEALVADGVDAVFTPSDNTVMTAELSIYETLAEAGIPHYTGADSFALNGAFVGYGVDYANLGVETANMIADILVNGSDPATTAVMTFDNGTATVNTEICEVLGFDYDEIVEAFSPLCTQVVSITTAESFDDLEG
ncbi:MAG: ABC transporter substrate-binding protein [Oscillospiraceae bacterium]|nr:ABC transporter substrate-binding protein [Oscillospiraceae bacterium]